MSTSTNVYATFFSATKELLPATYVTKERGTIAVKGKGDMKTFWLESKANRLAPSEDEVNTEINFVKNKFFKNVPFLDHGKTEQFTEAWHILRMKSLEKCA